MKLTEQQLAEIDVRAAAEVPAAQVPMRIAALRARLLRAGAKRKPRTVAQMIRGEKTVPDEPIDVSRD